MSSLSQSPHLKAYAKALKDYSERARCIIQDLRTLKSDLTELREALNEESASKMRDIQMLLFHFDFCNTNTDAALKTANQLEAEFSALDGLFASPEDATVASNAQSVAFRVVHCSGAFAVQVEAVNTSLKNIEKLLKAEADRPRSHWEKLLTRLDAFIDFCRGSLSRLNTLSCAASSERSHLKAKGLHPLGETELIRSASAAASKARWTVDRLVPQPEAIRKAAYEGTGALDKYLSQKHSNPAPQVE